MSKSRARHKAGLLGPPSAGLPKRERERPGVAAQVEGDVQSTAERERGVGCGGKRLMGDEEGQPTLKVFYGPKTWLSWLALIYEKGPASFLKLKAKDGQSRRATHTGYYYYYRN